MRRSLAVLAAGLVLSLAACATPQPEADPAASRARAQVTGTVSWRERIMLPPGTVLVVTLQDVSQADAPAKLIAAQRLEGAFAPPVKFALRYDPAKLNPAHRYTVSARIEVEGKLRFISDTAHPVLTQGAPDTAEVMVVGLPNA
jgi:putative lipoprotein